jgi:hypothetical protein
VRVPLTDGFVISALIATVCVKALSNARRTAGVVSSKSWDVNAIIQPRGGLMHVPLLVVVPTDVVRLSDSESPLGTNPPNLTIKDIESNVPSVVSKGINPRLVVELVALNVLGFQAVGLC